MGSGPDFCFLPGRLCEFSFSWGDCFSLDTIGTLHAQSLEARQQKVRERPCAVCVRMDSARWLYMPACTVGSAGSGTRSELLLADDKYSHRRKEIIDKTKHLVIDSKQIMFAQERLAKNKPRNVQRIFPAGAGGLCFLPSCSAIPSRDVSQEN